MARRFDDRPGFTLLELVVALTVVGFALAAGYGAFGMVVDRSEREGGRTERVVRAAAVRASLRSWIAGAHAARSQRRFTFEGLDGVHGPWADDALRIVTTSATPLDVRRTVVRLFIDRDPATPERGLVAAMSGAGQDETRRVELAPEARGLDARYLSRATGEARWLPSWLSNSWLPAGVELRLAAPPTDSLPALLQLPLLVGFTDGR